MNKKLLLLLCIIFFPNIVSAVQIHQVYYDPVNSESGGEAIEFYNPHPFEVDLGGWIIATESSERDAIFPANSSIPSHGYFLLADNNWDERKDDSNWRSADFTATITLNNADSGIALRNSTGHLIDAVGWGNSAEISEGLFKGSPAQDIAQGKVLLRINDTDDNSNDFVMADPDFFGDNVIPVEINVSGSDPGSAVILEGNSINPTAGGKTIIHVRSSSLLVATFLNTTKTMQMIDNTTYEVFFELDCHLAPGNYSISFSDNTVQQFEYLALRSFSVDAEKIGFVAVPGSSRVSSQKAVIKNMGNVDLVLSLEVQEIIDADIDFTYRLDDDDFVSFDDVFELQAGGSVDLLFKIELPAEIELGRYFSFITISSLEE
jgi:hypothetical protein